MVTEVDGFGPLRLASAHLAPSSPTQCVIEAEALALLAEKHELGPLIIGGDWNASDTLPYPADRVCTTLAPESIIGAEVIHEDDPQSEHRPVAARFSRAW